MTRPLRRHDVTPIELVRWSADLERGQSLTLAEQRRLVEALARARFEGVAE
jgi:hypothetical protein